MATDNRSVLYTGKAKVLYTGPTDDTIVQYFTDLATAFNGEKRDVLPGKGIINAAISAHLMTKIKEDTGISTHFIKSITDREQLICKLEMYPIEVVMRNIAAGSIVKRLGIEVGRIFPTSILEFYYKDDKLGDPIINNDHIVALGWVDSEILAAISTMARRINRYLSGLFYEANIHLVDFKLEFGHRDKHLMLADEISPDGCRLWDMETREIMDKDRFRLGMGGEIEAYKEVARRLGVH